MNQNNMKQPRGARAMRPFLILWIGQAVSLLGSQLVQFALIWWLTQETGSATVLAVASIVGLVPQVLLGPFVGVLVDRWNRRLTMLLADTAIAAATVVLAYLFATDAVAIWHVYALLFARALGSAFHGPAMTASTSLMVPEEHLTRVQGFNQMLQGGLSIAAAPLGALLLAILPLQGILAIDVITALVGIAALAVVAVPQPVRAVSAEGSEVVSTYWQELRQGLRYVRAWPALMMLMGLAMMINLVLAPVSTLMPLLVTDHFGGTAWHLSALEGVFGLGVVAGGIVLGVWGGFRRRIFTSLFGVIFIGVGVLLVGMAPATLFGLAVFGMFLSGFMGPITNGPIISTFQALVAPEMQGRVFTLLTSLSAGMMPLALLVAGPVAEVVGVRSWYLFGGSVTMAMGVIGFFLPLLRQLEEGSRDVAAAPAELTAAASGEIVTEAL